MASREVREFYGKPPEENDNAKDKNPKWEMSLFGSIDLKSCIVLVSLLGLQFRSIDPKFLNCFIVFVRLIDWID